MRYRIGTVHTVQPLRYLPRQRVTVKIHANLDQRKLFTTLYNTKVRMTINIAGFHTIVWLSPRKSEERVMHPGLGQRIFEVVVDSVETFKGKLWS